MFGLFVKNNTSPFHFPLKLRTRKSYEYNKVYIGGSEKKLQVLLASTNKNSNLALLAQPAKRRGEF